jgi:hypothetical protein
MSADLATLERRQVERIGHLQALQRLIDAEQLKIDNLRSQGRIERTVHRFALVHGYTRG